MRVLLVITKGNIGGAQRYVLDLARAAKRKGMAVAVAHGAGEWLPEELEKCGVRHLLVPSLGRDIRIAADIRAFFQLWRVIRHERPNVLHLNSSKAAAIGALIGRMLGVPRIVVTVHGWAFNEVRPLIERLAIYAIQWVTVLLSHVSIVISHADLLRGERLPFCREKIELVHNGIEAFERFSKYDARARLRAHAKGLRQEDVWVGTIAELTPNKGIDVLLAAFEGAEEEHPEAELLIIGGGALHHSLTEQARRSRAIERIHFIDLGAKVPGRSFIGAFDIFVLPSRKEGLPYVLLEAGLAALPCVATRVGGNTDIIEHDVSGLLVPPEDPMALRKELTLLIPDIPRRVALGRALEKRVSALFTLTRMAEETFRLYRHGSF